MTEVLINGKFEHRHAQGEHQMEMKAETRVMSVEIQGCLRLPANHQKLSERHRADSVSQPSEGTNLAWVCSLQSGDHTFLLYKPRSLWYVLWQP